jgi:23S rRNA (guanine745-N1)-methyltransferase
LRQATDAALKRDPAFHFFDIGLMPSIVCPICCSALTRHPGTWTCAQGHGFDVAREGYVNLLPVQHKHSRAPGDNAGMVQARRDFLQAGHYQALREAIRALLSPLQAQTLLDLGCGEGYYTSALAPIVADIAGVDIAKPAIRLASKRCQNITWLVASSAALPLAEASVDVVTCLFTQLYVGQIRRVLKVGGHALVVTPSADHLWSLRQALFEEVRMHEPDKFLAGFEGSFALRSRSEVRIPLRLDQTSLQQLVQMTPYAWKAKPERRAALLARASLLSEAAFTLFLLVRKASAAGEGEPRAQD